MNFLLFAIACVISYILNIFYLFNGVVPLFWLPYVIFKILRGDLRVAAILACIVAPIVWLFVFGFVGFLSIKLLWLGKIVNFICFSNGGIFGGILALISVIFNVLSKQARDEFYRGMLQYEKN